MLQKIRDNSKSFGSKIFIGFIVFVFGVFGMGSLVGTYLNRVSVVSVNGVEIDEYEVDYETQVKTQELINSLGPDADLSQIDESLIREAALNELIQQELLTQAANKAGMSVSSASIDRRIAQTPDFQVDGVFNNERAQLLLQSMGYTNNSYRATLAREALLNQMLVAYSGSGFVTRSEIEHLASILNQTRDLRYIMINVDYQAEGVEITDEEIEARYQANQGDFMQEEQVSLAYLVLDKEDIYPEVSVTEEQIRARYQEEIAEYQSQIERRASHILLEAFSEDDYAAAESLATDLKSRIDAGESFEDLAGEYSDDPGSAENGGDVGYTTGDNFVEEFEQALRELDVGEVSDPVRTEFGYHLIKLTEQTASEIESFEDSRERIERDLQTNEVDARYAARAEELGNLAFESIDLQDPAEIMGLEIQTTGLFGRSGGAGIAANGDVINAAFSQEVLLDELNSNLIALTPSRSVVIRVVQHNPPAVMALEEVRDEIEIELRFERLSDQARTLGESLLGSLRNGQNIDGLLASQDLNWNQLNGLERANRNIPPELVNHVFTMPAPTEGESVIDGFQLAGGDYVIVDLQQVNVGSIDDFEEGELQGLENFISQQGAAASFNALLTGLENRADIRR